MFLGLSLCANVGKRNVFGELFFGFFKAPLVYCCCGYSVLVLLLHEARQG